MNTVVRLILFFAAFNLFAQEMNVWHNFTDMREVQYVASGENSIICATTGGTFFFDPADSTFIKLTKSEGLRDQTNNAVAIDVYGKSWIGTEEGYIIVLDENKNILKTIIDIANSDEPLKRINQIVTKGDTIYVATEFGISLINAKEYTFFDTVIKFGDFDSKISVNSIYVDKQIFVSTSAGIAISKINSTNLIAPESWNSYEFGTEVNGYKINRISKFAGTYLAGSDVGILEFNGTSWKLKYDNSEVLDLMSMGDSLIYITTASLKLLYNGITDTKASFSGRKFNNFSLHGNSIYISSNIGLVKYFNGVSKTIYPNGLTANFVQSIDVDINGNIWTGSGKTASGAGINMFDGKTWFNFNKSNTTNINTNSYYKVFAGADENVYFGNWGDGITIYSDGAFTTYNSENTDLVGDVAATNFIVITDLRTDTNGNLWMLNLSGASAEVVSVFTNNGDWHHYKFGSPLFPQIAGPDNLAIDQYGTKWFSVLFDATEGLYYFNENGTFDNTADDDWGIIRTADGLNSNTINSLAVDNRGELWVGSNLGANVIPNTNSPKSRISSVFAVRQQNITNIIVDPLNRKWLGSNQGIFLLSSDGTNLIANYTKTNSPLPSNDIIDLAFDDKKGILYAATAFGITSLTTEALQPVTNFTELFVYPNPFKLKPGDGRVLKIDNLIKDSHIKILTVSGNLVNEFNSPGGRVALWDGRDISGQYVASGIYVIIANDEEANSIITGKVAVIRE